MQNDMIDDITKIINPQKNETQKTLEKRHKKIEMKGDKKMQKQDRSYKEMRKEWESFLTNQNVSNTIYYKEFIKELTAKELFYIRIARIWPTLAVIVTVLTVLIILNIVGYYMPLNG